nr:probable disease resistance protein At5g66900 [Ipomoea batatas]
MAGSLIGGAVLSVAFDKLFTAVVDAGRRVAAFRSDFESLNSTLSQIKPIFEDIEKLNKLIGTQEDETEALIKQLKDGEALIEECLKIKRHHLCKKWRCSKKLTKLEKSLSFRDSKQTLAMANGVDQKMDEALAYLKNLGTS